MAVGRRQGARGRLACARGWPAQLGDADVPLPPMPTGPCPEAPKHPLPFAISLGCRQRVKRNRPLSGQIPETPEAWRPRFLQDPHSGRRGCSPHLCVGTLHLQLGQFSQITSGNAHPTQPFSLLVRSLCPLPCPGPGGAHTDPGAAVEALAQSSRGHRSGSGGRPFLQVQLSSGTEPRATCSCVRPWRSPVVSCSM